MQWRSILSLFAVAKSVDREAKSPAITGVSGAVQDSPVLARTKTHLPQIGSLRLRALLHQSEGKPRAMPVLRPGQAEPVRLVQSPTGRTLTTGTGAGEATALHFQTPIKPRIAHPVPAASGIFQLSASSSIIRNVSGTGSSQNEAFVAGAPCPSAVSGNFTVTSLSSVPVTFLANAVELVNDPIRNPTGNNNGVCETGEACVYSPNFGVYQGSGALSAGTCTFQNGTVSGVSMYTYTTNGI